jgi:hypothetical protein
MNETFRPCPECGGEQLFEQHHATPADCPDSVAGECPEWSCAVCGAALLADFPPPRAERAEHVRPHGKVA